MASRELQEPQIHLGGRGHRPRTFKDLKLFMEISLWPRNNRTINNSALFQRIPRSRKKIIKGPQTGCQNKQCLTCSNWAREAPSGSSATGHLDGQIIHRFNEGFRALLDIAFLNCIKLMVSWANHFLLIILISSFNSLICILLDSNLRIALHNGCCI